MNEPQAMPLASWIGRQRVEHDRVDPVRACLLAATLDGEPPAEALPPLWHWTLFLPSERQSQIGPDGHARRGSFLPPVELPRRMWAGGRLEFLRPLRLGAEVTRTSTIADITTKQGRSGALVFVRVRHELASEGATGLVEEHDIVYRAAAQPGEVAPPPRPAPADAAWQREIVPDPVLLFRYSALTFNGHRIHYDRAYATGTEGYPGLVVHGPLIATLLAELVRAHAPARRLARFDFKAVRPLFDIASFAVCGQADAAGREVALWARDADGMLAMEATATLA